MIYGSGPGKIQAVVPSLAHTDFCVVIPSAGKNVSSDHMDQGVHIRVRI